MGRVRPKTSWPSWTVPGPRGLEVPPVSAPTIADGQSRIDLDDLIEVAPRAHVAAHGHHPRRRRSTRSRPTGRPLGPLYPAAGVPRPVRLDHAEHADRRPADDRVRHETRGIARSPFPPRLSPDKPRIEPSYIVAIGGIEWASDCECRGRCVSSGSQKYVDMVSQLGRNSATFSQGRVVFSHQREYVANAHRRHFTG